MARTPLKFEAGLLPRAATTRDTSVGFVGCHPETSYWLGDANEMAAINTILIIVNSTAR
jgi:hypothetical protein